MSDVAISVRNIGKQYALGTRQPGYATLRDTLARAAVFPRRAARVLRGKNTDQCPSDERFLALDDVTFDIKHGEVVGVVGRNGAGKSTLLKILSRITEPSSGSAEIHGRVGSLLEVGVGFHPELTGRDNVYLNGAILGMKRAEIGCTFDEIVAFAEISKFIDTPVKHYSSGMYLRLAFAVAAHLETEVLLVDEVLAVGDIGFQRKCLAKMNEVAREGRTVFLVSHSMAAIQALCSRVLMFKDGRLHKDSSTLDVLEYYIKANSSAAQARLSRQPASEDCVARITGVQVLDDSSNSSAQVFPNTGLTVRVDFEAVRIMKPVLGVVIKTAVGLPILGVNNRVIPSPSVERSVTAGTISAKFATLPLAPGMYLLDLYLGDEHMDHDVVTEAVTFEVHPSDVFGSGKLPPASAGPILWPATFSLDDRPVQAHQSQVI